LAKNSRPLVVSLQQGQRKRWPAFNMLAKSSLDLGILFSLRRFNRRDRVIPKVNITAAVRSTKSVTADYLRNAIESSRAQ
jgi:hypothetical protein